MLDKIRLARQLSIAEQQGKQTLVVPSDKLHEFLQAACDASSSKVSQFTIRKINENLDKGVPTELDDQIAQDISQVMLHLVSKPDENQVEPVSDDDSEDDDSFLHPENLKNSSLVMLNQSNNDQTYNSTHRVDDDMTMVNGGNMHSSNVFFNHNEDNTMDLSMTTGNKTRSTITGLPTRLASNNGLANRSCVSKTSVFDPISAEGIDAALIVPKIRYNHG